MASNISTAATFQFSGLASGIDSTKLIDQLMEISSLPIKKFQQRQEDYQVQISTIGTMITQLKGLESAAAALSTTGTVAIQPNSTYDDFTVSGSAKAEGSFDIRVERLAKEAKFRSSKFTSAQDASLVADENLQFSIDGVNSVVIDTTGKTLADVAEAINQNVAQLSASVISTGDGYYLNLSRKTTGYTTTPEAALTIVQGVGLGLTQTQAAQNAKIHVDGLAIERTSNTITNVLQGVTLSLNSDSNVSERVVFLANSGETATKLNSFIEAYNELANTIREQLVTDPTKSYGETLVNGTLATTIQREMQRMISQTVMASGGVRTLGELGMEIQRDGTLELNALTMNAAISESPEAANAIFSNATTGIAAQIKNFVKAQTSTTSGILVQRKNSLTSSIHEMDEKIETTQVRLDAERKRLVSQFTAMEQLFSSLKGLDSYLTSLSNMKLGSE